MREFLVRRLRRAPIIEQLWDEYERMLAARDAAYAERDAALAARDAALAQGDVLSKIISKSMRVPSVLDEPQIAVDEACSLTSIRLYEIWTSHGSQLFADEKTGCVYHARHSARGCRILVWLPPGRSGDCFLLSSIANIPFLHLTMDGDRGPAISLRLIKRNEGKVAFIHPTSSYFVCAEPGDIEAGASIIANRATLGSWEEFSLIATPDFPDTLISEISILSHMLKRIQNVPSALDFLLATIGDAIVRDRLPAVLRLLRPYEIEWLGRALARDKKAAVAFALAFTNNLWANEALPGLSADTSERSAISSRVIDESFDLLCQAGFDGRYISVGQMCNAFARRDRAASRGICIVATARNEGPYFLEWIAYHRALGVEAFFIYTNDNDDGSDDLLDALAREGVITWVRSKITPMFSPQYKAYGHAFQVLPEIVTYRWAAVIDLDEFIVLDKREFATISDFVAAREVDRVDAIALNWLVFGSNGETRYTEELVTRRFVTRDPAVNRHVKSLCRPSSFVHNQCHYPIADDYTSWVFRDSSGDMHPKDRTGDAAAFSPTPGGECAWINHYLTKSAEEMILRRIYSNASFGWTAEPSGEHFESWMIEGFMRLHDAEKLIVDARAVGCVPALKAEIEKLYSIPGVENAMGKIALLQRKRIRQVDLVLQSDPRFQAAGSNEKWFAEVISEAARLSQ